MTDDRQIFDNFDKWVEECKKMSLIFDYIGGKQNEIFATTLQDRQKIAAWNYTDRMGYIDAVKVIGS